MKIGIYGGTFDPPHLGHMAAAREAMERAGLDQLLLIPNRLPPHKSLHARSATGEDRLEMTRLMAEGLGPWAEVLDMELTREGPSYTVDTLKALEKTYPQGELFLLMGSDMFLSFSHWKAPGEIARMARLLPFSREEESPPPEFEVQKARLEADFGARVQPIPLATVQPMSSTQIRSLLEKAETRDQGGALLWPQVYGYILERGLYGIEGSMKNLTPQALRAVSYAMIKAKRIPHVRGTEETAITLAKHWGEDEEAASRAAILHDCTKYWELPEQLALCEKYRIPLTDLERASVKLLHAKTGAALAQHVFGESPAICQAIANHTTGHPAMSRLDKVLYLADFMEPNRDFEGVEALRALVYEDLDRAMILGLTMTVAELREKGAQINENTMNTLAFLRGTRL